MPKTDTQCKKCRRAGEKLFLKGEKCSTAKCPMVKRNFVPGMHGNKGPARLTNYGTQLKEKQKAKRIYGLREKQFANYFGKALSKTGNTAEWAFKFLESRLDNTVYRLGFADSRQMARQLVNHGHFRVNGKKVDVPSYQIKTGQEIDLSDKSKKMKAFENISQKLENKKKDLAPWLSLDAPAIKAKVTGAPKLGDVEMNINWRVIVEFYSK